MSRLFNHLFCINYLLILSTFVSFSHFTFRVITMSRLLLVKKSTQRKKQIST